jgi:hypothetical protein
MKKHFLIVLTICIAFYACKKDSVATSGQAVNGSSSHLANILSNPSLSAAEIPAYKGDVIVRDYLTGFQILDCSGNTLTAVSGTATINLRYDGNVRSIVISNFAFQAADGTIWHGIYRQSYAIYMQNAATVTFRFAFHPVGGGVDIQVHGTFHTTVNANGDITVDFAKVMDTSCQ